MFKLTWASVSNKFCPFIIIVPDVYTLFEVYHLLKGYEPKDGSTPAYIEVTNLDGIKIDMSKGLAYAASRRTCSQPPV